MWVIVERWTTGHRQVVAVHLPKENTVWSAVDTAREIRAERPIRQGPSGPIEYCEPRQVRDLGGREYDEACAAVAAREAEWKKQRAARWK